MNITNTRKIAACAVMVALLIAVQYAFSMVAGVELVTVFVLCFCYVYGIYCGAMTATAFSLMRCLIFGFTPSVIVLYLIYYNVFAIVFGLMGKCRLPKCVPPILLVILAFLTAFFAIKGVPISVLFQQRLRIMLWVLFGIIVALLIFNIFLLVKNKGPKGQEITGVTTIAVFLTMMFTILDDVITPIFSGFDVDAAIGYVYTGFLAMIPQMICVSISVLLLFYPIKKIFMQTSATVAA